LFNEKRTVKSHSSPFLSVQLHNVVTQRFLDEISTDGGVCEDEEGERKVRKVELLQKKRAPKRRQAERVHPTSFGVSSPLVAVTHSSDTKARNMNIQIYAVKQVLACNI
jgi:hypothetical protein